MNLDYLDNINPTYLIFLYSILGSIITIINTYNIENINILSYVFIRYMCDMLILIFIYFVLLSPQQKQYIFTNKSFNIWKISIFITIISFISYILYMYVLQKFGPTKTKSMSYSFSIIITLILSYLFLKNNYINFTIIIGLIFVIIGLNLIINNSNIKF